MDLRQHIRQIPDFPKPGILFYDISTLLAHSRAWAETIERLTDAVAPFEPTKLLGVESRGFLVAAPLALRMGLGFVMVRKRGKLPGATVVHHYELEYGSDAIEIQSDALAPGDRVVVLDDLLATGGTLAATVALARRQKAEVAAVACIIELTFLNGRERLDVPCRTLVTYES